VAKAKEDKETPHKDIPLKPLIPWNRLSFCYINHDTTSTLGRSTASSFFQPLITGGDRSGWLL
jgi:hypothetical protein